MRVLAIVHEPNVGPGVFAETIPEANAALDTWLFPQAEQPPRDLLGYDAVVTLGGAMHPDRDDEHPWLAHERALLCELVEHEVPLLGVCLGAQLIAEASGSSASRRDVPEIGWYEVQTTPEATDDPVLGPLGPRFDALEWHTYQFHLPPGGTPLAHSATCLQAYRVARSAWGIQFHAEVTLGDFESWLDDYRDDPDAVRLGLDAGEFRSRTRGQIGRWNRLGRDLFRRFLAVAGERR